jgi:hypothetical protein
MAMLLLMLRAMLLGMAPFRLLKPLLLKVGTCWQGSASIQCTKAHEVG